MPTSLVDVSRPQDLRHTQMLLHIVPAYFREQLSQYQAGKTDFPMLIEAVGYARRLLAEGWVGNASRMHHLDFSGLIPSDVTRRLESGAGLSD